MMGVSVRAVPPFKVPGLANGEKPDIRKEESNLLSPYVGSREHELSSVSTH